jgi:hypothetical protein
MNKKVFNALKTLYADKGLGQTELEELAGIVGQNLSEDASEDDINNAASGVSAYVDIMQKVGNRYASAIEAKYKGYVKPEPTGQEKKKPEQSTPNNLLTEERVAEMLREALQPFKEKEERQRLNDILAGQEKLKGIPSKFVGRYNLEKEEDAASLASQIEQDYAEERKAILSSLGLADIPLGNGGEPDSDEDFAKKMQDAQKALAKS